MQDNTEAIRKGMIAADREDDVIKAKLQEEHGQVWTTEELQRDFQVISFLAPFVRVERKSDGAGGTLQFIHVPRFYYGFQAA